jgi:hypothetical protein
MPNPSATEYVPESYKPSQPVEEAIPEKNWNESPFSVHHVTKLPVASESLPLDTGASTLWSSLASFELPPSELPEFSIPASYFQSQPILKASMITKFTECTLFYMFF